ncbi:hypothetical protein L0F63_002142 [Massospora cicadina]|nr:hypothetical protein L0F63_002142 [Massospora cicadina]
MSLNFYRDPTEPIETCLLKFLGADDQNISRMDVYENDKETVIHVELPGFKKEDISLDVSEENSCLTLRGTSKRNESFNEGQLRCSERSYGSFARTIRLPIGSEFDKVGAKFNDGILEINVPKNIARTKRQISIE